jgi:drug/metabolite transporter (DMT)-like permease
MLLLAATIIANTSFALILRGAQQRRVDDVAVGMINYIFASATYWLIAGVWWPEQGASIAVRFGLFGGCFNVAIFLLLLTAMHLKGVAVSIAMVRLAVVVPLAAAIIFFHEAPEMVQSWGIMLALLALPLLSLDKGVSDQPLTLQRMGMLLGLFVCNGMALLLLKWYQTTGTAAGRFIYLATVFTVSGLIVGLVWARAQHRWLGKAELVWGTWLGLSNAITNILIFMTLDVLLASVMFPILAAVGLSLTTILAAVFWREIPGKLGWAGITLAVVAVVLANL